MIRYLLSSVLLLTCLGCTSTGARVELPEPSTLNGVRVETTGLYRFGYASVIGINGVATNQSGRDLRLCTIHYDAVNEADEKVADAIASTSSGILAGEAWRFQAVFTTPFSSEFKSLRLRRVDSY